MGYNSLMDIPAPMLGIAGELRVRSELLIRGIGCGSFDFDNGTDVVLSNGLKIGVKTALRPNKDEKAYSWKYSFSIRQPQVRGAKKGLYTKKFTRRNYIGFVDYWIFWMVEADTFYIIPNDQIGQKVSLVIPTPDEKRIYKKHTWKESTSKYEKYKNNWEQLK